MDVSLGVKSYFTFPLMTYMSPFSPADPPTIFYCSDFHCGCSVLSFSWVPIDPLHVKGVRKKGGRWMVLVLPCMVILCCAHLFLIVSLILDMLLIKLLIKRSLCIVKSAYQLFLPAQVSCMQNIGDSKASLQVQANVLL